MCEANAYLLENESKPNETLLMEAVDKVEPDGDGIRLVSIFGEQKFIKGRIHSLSLVDHKVYIKP
ncbi:MAG: CooT family nickel-binding protein [Proteobacteria bacterium]|nr:CooT family nickel-binding protein [Pseudomonadota bacterium]MBU1585311.1 CooT family nickel-binding protein [Pseudomonadota bacterium]MBU2452228.1 CooT family nickel-binding protein [Pseudomonadota bacterium]MBU2631225.1 CooT family nickel-binding protein [Pseudomonadota bacterium]